MSFCHRASFSFLPAAPLRSPPHQGQEYSNPQGIPLHIGAHHESLCTRYICLRRYNKSLRTPAYSFLLRKWFYCLFGGF